jgi:hypothetical protein
MKPVLIGYMAKRTAHRPSWLRAPDVTEICSASWCISKTHDAYFTNEHINEASLFDSEGLAWGAVPEAVRGQFSMYAFALFPMTFEAMGDTTRTIPGLSVEPLSLKFRSLGFDAVSDSGMSGPVDRKPEAICFECSPLSCNSKAEIMATNPYCLLDSYEEASQAARKFAQGQAEPGPYLVVEVFRNQAS